MERRLAAILAADVVGYSRLMGQDEAGTLARLEGLKAEILDPLIAQHHGRVVKLMGDGFLVEFASVVDALTCALDWQGAVEARAGQVPEERAMRFRIGVNLGDVMVKGDDLYGEGVNVAARLEGLAEPGSVLVSRTVFDHAKGKLGADFENLGEQVLKNIAEPVRVFRATMRSDIASAPALVRPTSKLKRLPVVATVVALLVVAAGAALWLKPWEQREEPASLEAMAFPLPDKPSIAVLPFTNMSGDPEQEYFADGMTEDLITDLSKVSGLFVIARNSVFIYKGKPVKVRQVAEELGVRYVLEGSVRRAGDEVRINAQLIDAMTGGHLWAERYDGSLADVFALQDKVTRQIVTALALKLTAGAGAEQIPKETENAAAYDAFLKGWEHYRLDTPEQYAKALRFFDEATEIDPGYDRAWAAMASVYWKAYRQDWAAVLATGSTEARSKAFELIAKASEKPTLLAYQVTSQMAVWRGKFDEAIEAAEQARALDPNDADSQVVLAEALIYGGEPERAQILIESARRHDPHNEARYAFLQGLAEFGRDQYEAAATSFRRTLELNPVLWNPEGRLGNTYCQPCVVLIAAYGHLGKIDDAQVLIEKIKMDWPGFNITTEAYYWLYKTDTDMKRFTVGLLKAGVPENPFSTN